MTDRAPKPAAGRPRREHSASNAASHRRHDLASPVGLLVLTLVLSTGGCLTTPGDAYPPPPTADGGPREISTEPLDRAVADDAPPPDAPSLDTPNPPPDSSRVDASPEDTVTSLMSVEARLEATRLAGDAAYSVARHIEVLIALLAEARFLRGGTVA